MLKVERIRLGVKAFIVHQGKFLIVKELVLRNGEEEIVHDLPGGGVDLGETLHEALHREVLEEVGLKIKIEHPVGGWDFMVPSFADADALLHIVCLGYQCQLVGEAKIDISHNPAKEDILEARWVTKEEVLEHGEGFFAANADVRQAIKFLKIT